MEPRPSSTIGMRPLSPWTIDIFHRWRRCFETTWMGCLLTYDTALPMLSQKALMGKFSTSKRLQGAFVASPILGSPSCSFLGNSNFTYTKAHRPRIWDCGVLPDARKSFVGRSPVSHALDMQAYGSAC